MAAPLRRACLRRLAQSKLSNHIILCETGCPTLQIHATASRNRSLKQQDDFFGINEDQKQVKQDGSETTDPAEAKTSHTRETQMRKILRSLEKKSKGELVYQTVFGQVRLDSKAKKKSLNDVGAEPFLQAVSRSSQTEPHTTEQMAVARQQTKREKKSKRPRRRDEMRKQGDSISTESSMNYFDEQYFGGTVSENVHDPALSQNVRQERSQQVTPPQQIDVSNSSSTEKAASIEDSSDEYQPVASREHADNFIDQVCFPSLTTDSVDASFSNQRSLGNVSKDGLSSNSFIDEQYFPHHFQPDDPSGNFQRQSQPEGKGSLQKQQLSCMTQPRIPSAEHEKRVQVKDISEHGDYSMQTESQTNTEREPPSHEDFSFIDGQYFDGDSNTAHTSLEDTVIEYGIANQGVPPQFAQSPKTSSQALRDGDTQTTNDFQLHSQTPDVSGQKGKVSSVKQEVKEVEDSAYQAAMKLRKNLRSKKDEKKAEAVSANRERVQAFKEQVPDLDHMPAVEVAKLLADSLIFENDDFIAVSKPYGLPSHGGPGVRVSVGQVLEPLSRRLDRGRGQLDNLYLVHRLDKETTGVMLLAKNAEVAWQLLGMFRRREVGKTYWTVTRGLPQPYEGVIDIPLARKRVNGIYKTVVRPKVYVSDGKIKTETWNRRDDNSSAAVTEYKVLAHRDSMALVECRPLTGIQHQIRAHMAQALNAPVLGDHKYSHTDRLAPQKLFPEALQKLGIRQAQVRHVPMHLHAKMLLLPEWRGRTNIFISANIPRFFLYNLKILKIKIPPK